MPQNPRQNGDPEIDRILSGYVKDKVREEATRQGVPVDFADRMANTESAYKPDVVKGQRRSSAGAIGAMQIMPGTAKDLKVDAYNVNQNIEGGIRYAKTQLDAFGGDQRKASAAYNWGPGNVRKYGVERAPAETQNYMRKVAGQSQQADPEIENLLKQYQQEKGAQQQPDYQTRTYPKQYIGSETDPAKQKADKANWSRQFSTNFDINEVGPGSTTDNPPKITPVPRAPQQPSTTTPNVFNKTLAQDQRAATGDARAALDFRNASPQNDALRLTAKVAQAEQFNRAQPGDAARRKRIEETRQRVAGRNIIGRTAEKAATQFALNSPEWLTPEAKADVEERAVALGLAPATRDEWLYKPATQMARSAVNTAATGVQGAAEIGDVIRRNVPGVQSAVNAVGDVITGDGSTEARAQSLLRGARALPRQARQITPLADPNDQSWLGQKIPSALGSSAVFGPVGAAGQAARLSAPLVSGMTGAMIGAGSSAQKADAAKIPQDRRDASVMFGAGTGATEAAGFERFLGGAGRIPRPARAIGQDVAQEYGQQYLEDVNDKYIGQTDPNASMNPFSRNKLEAGLLGGIVSGVQSSPQIAGDAITARQSRIGAQQVANEPRRPMGLTPTAVGPTERVKVTPEVFQRANAQGEKGFTEPLTEPLTSTPQVAPTAPVAPAADAAPAVAGMPNRADFEPGFVGDMEYQAALVQAQRAPKAAKPAKAAAVKPAAVVEGQSAQDFATAANLAKQDASDAENAGNYEAAIPQWEAAHKALVRQRRTVAKTATAQELSDLDGDISRADLRRKQAVQQAALAKRNAERAAKQQASAPQVPQNQQVARKVIRSGEQLQSQTPEVQQNQQINRDPQSETAPTRDLSAPLPASVEASPRTAPPAPVKERGLRRNYRAGMNNAAVEFTDSVQRDLFDLAAKEKYSMGGGQNKTYNRPVGDIAGLRESLRQRLGVDDSELSRLAGEVRDDVRAQMKGVKDGETRRLVSNVKRQEAPPSVDAAPRTPAEIPRIQRPIQPEPTQVENKPILPPVQARESVLTPQTNRITEGAGDELPRRVSRPLAGQPAEVPENPAPSPADRLARLRAAAQQAPPMELAQPERPSEAPPVNDRLERLKRIANQVNQQFAQPEQPALQPEAPKAQPELVAAAKRPPAPTGEPKLSNRVVKQSLQEEMGATSTNRSDKLRLSGPSENYREVVTKWDDAPEGTVFRKPEHYGDETNVLFDRRLEDRKTTNGDNAVFFMEAQSDWHQSKDAPPAPMKNTWLRRALDDTAREASEAGQDGVLLPKTVEQLYEIQRWGAVKEKDGRYTNSEGFDITPVVRRYLKELPDLAKKAANKNGVELQTRTVDDGRGGQQELWFLPVKKAAKLAETAPVAEVKAPEITPVEDVDFAQLAEQSAAQRAAKAEKPQRRKMTGELSPIEYLKRKTNKQGFRVSDKGEARRLGSKESGIVGLTNKRSKFSTHDAQVMLDEGGFAMPDGRAFTDPSVTETDVLTYLENFGKQSRQSTGQLNQRLADEEAEYYRQQEEQEAAPQSDVERRRLIREGAPKGEFGKLSEYARTRATEDRALAGSNELRDLLGLPEMPPYLSEETGKTTEWSKAAQETMDALAELAGFDRQRSSQMGLEGLRDAWKGLQAKAKSLNVQISADLRDRFIHTAKTYQVAFLEPYKRLHESNEVVDNALRRIEEIYEQKRPLTTEETRQLYRTLRDEFVKEGLTENYFRKTYWPSIKEAAGAYSGEVRQARRAGNRRDVQVDEPATKSSARPAKSTEQQLAAVDEELAAGAITEKAAATMKERIRAAAKRAGFGPLENEPSGPVATMFGGQKILDSLRAGRRPVGATKEAPRTPEDWDVADYIKKHVAQLKPSKRADGTVIRPELPLTEAQGRELASTVSRLVAASSKNDRAEMFQAKTQIDNLVMAAKRASRRQDPIAKLRPELTEARRWAEDKYKDGKISESHKDNVLRAATALEAAGKLRIPADIQTARRELLNAKRDVRADDKWKRRAYKIGDTAAQTVRGAQTAVFGSDWSYIFRQGGPVALNPMNVFNTFKAFQMAYHAQGRESAQPQGKLGVFSKAFVGSKGAEWVRDQIKNHPAYEDAVRADLKLALTTEAEEIYKDNYVAKLPWIKRTEAANEAALDWLRLSEFTRYKKQIDAQKGERTFAQRQKDLERAAETINTLTGRTDLGEGRIKKAVDFLNGWMSAPRLNVSRVKILDPTRIAREYAKSPATAKRMTKDAILTVAPWAAAIALGNAAGIWSSTLDYDDPDFGKIKVGDTRYDVGFGLLPLLRLYLKAAEYGSKAANDAVRQTAATKKARKDAGEIAGQAAKTYVRGRLGPLASYANDQWWGSNIIGEEVTPRQILANPLTEKQSPVRRLVIPVTYGEMGEMGWKYGAQRKAEGTGGIIKGAAAGVARGLPGMVGFGVQDYEKKPRRKIGASR